MNPQLLWLIPILPFAGFLLNGTIGRKLPRALVATIALLFTAAPAVIVAMLWNFMKFSNGPLTLSVSSRPWIAVSGFQVNFAFTVDHLTLIMLAIITGVGFLIHLYSVGYMALEDGYWRFFAYLNLFMFFMLVLVLSAASFCSSLAGKASVSPRISSSASTSRRIPPPTPARKPSSSIASATSAFSSPCSCSSPTSAP